MGRLLWHDVAQDSLEDEELATSKDSVEMICVKLGKGEVLFYFLFAAAASLAALMSGVSDLRGSAFEKKGCLNKC